MNRLSLADGIDLFQIVTPDHHFTARTSAQSVNVQLWTCTLVSGNRTLFKQGSSETQDGETLIVSAKEQQDHLWVRQTNQKQPPVL